MNITLGYVLRVLSEIAPPSLAENWDNVGLQIGDLDSKIKKAWTVLDPCLSVIEKAHKENVDLIISHHPLFFNKISNINTNSTIGKIIKIAIKNNIGIISAHSNFDIVKGGINDIISKKLELKNIRILDKKQNKQNIYKLVFFIPKTSEYVIKEALYRSKIGKIDQYSCCSFRNYGIGTFLPNNKANPAYGKKNSFSEINEVRIEIPIIKKEIKHAISIIKREHPYETVPYDIYPLYNNQDIGLGRIGELKNEMTLKNLIKKIKFDLNLKFLKVAGNLESNITSVAICSGSGSSTLKSFFSSGAQVYISGDINYHAAHDACNLGLSIIDIGHFNSEHIAIAHLAKKIKKLITNENFSVTPFNTEKNIFKYI